ncbi:MAG TPA: hypothetical protein DEP45_15725 [Armatimonadetes bacterium]|nr:hypothetical protein [Armatimonadota bacterium]
MIGVRACVAVTVLFAATVAWGQDLGPNLVPNGDFEATDSGGWGFNEQRRVVEMDDAPSGSHVLRMECRELQYHFAVVGPNVPIEPRTLYRISVKIKRDPAGGQLRIGGGTADAEGKGLTRGDWALGAYPIMLQLGERALACQCRTYASPVSVGHTPRLSV